MHRMRHFVMWTGLSLAVLATLSGRASADLIESNPAQTYPDLFGGNVNGKVTYTYDPATQTGKFSSVNLPTYIATGQDGPDGPGEQLLPVVPDTSGIRQQVVNVTLDKSGNLVPGASNGYQLHGTVVVPAVTDASGTVITASKTVEGLLLQGTPTAFGSLAIPGSALSTFDLKMEITGGALADYFGKEAYLEITPKVGSTFTGDFTKDFVGFKVTSNTRGSFITPPPLNVPEPTTLVILLFGGAGMAYRHRRRLRA